MLAKHWQHWQSVGKFADVLPTLPTDGQHWPDLACLLGKRWCEQEIQQFFTAYGEGFGICDFTGVKLFDLPNLEDFFKLNIIVYEIEDAIATLMKQSCEIYRETMRLNLHLSLITDFEKCCHVFKCNGCDKFLTNGDHFMRHTKTYCTIVRKSYPRGIHKNTPNIFEKLEDITAIQ